MTDKSIHVMCTCQVHSCSNISDSQITNVSESLSASANYLRKLVEGTGNTSSSPKAEPVKTEDAKNEASTVSVHADSSYCDVLKGFTTYDAKDIDTEAYSVKRQAYDAVRQKYPDLDNLVRDDKVQAMKELRAVGFKYYSIQVIAFVVVDGMTKTVSSKSHHRLEKPSKEYLESILTDTFKGTVRVEDKKTSDTKAKGESPVKEGPTPEKVEENSSETKTKSKPPKEGPTSEKVEDNISETKTESKPPTKEGPP